MAERQEKIRFGVGLLRLIDPLAGPAARIAVRRDADIARRSVRKVDTPQADTPRGEPGMARMITTPSLPSQEAVVSHRARHQHDGKQPIANRLVHN